MTARGRWLAGLTLALVLAGCGGGEAPPTTPTTPTSPPAGGGGGGGGGAAARNVMMPCGVGSASVAIRGTMMRAPRMNNCTAKEVMKLAICLPNDFLC